MKEKARKGSKQQQQQRQAAADVAAALSVQQRLKPCDCWAQNTRIARLPYFLTTLRKNAAKTRELARATHASGGGREHRARCFCSVCARRGSRRNRHFDTGCGGGQRQIEDNRRRSTRSCNEDERSSHCQCARLPCFVVHHAASGFPVPLFKAGRMGRGSRSSIGEEKWVETTH